MTNYYEVHVIFQDIEHQLHESSIIIVLYKIFIELRSIFYPLKIISHKDLHLIPQIQVLYPDYFFSDFLSSYSNLHLILWITSERLLATFDIQLAINLALWINCNICDICFVIFSPFLSILVTSFFIVTVKVIYFSVFLMVF